MTLTPQQADEARKAFEAWWLWKFNMGNFPKQDTKEWMLCAYLHQQSRINALEEENARLREKLEYISFASCVAPTVIDGEDVPEKYELLIRSCLRRLGEAAEEALTHTPKEGKNGSV